VGRVTTKLLILATCTYIDIVFGLVVFAIMVLLQSATNMSNKYDDIEKNAGKGRYSFFLDKI
jgi:1,4-dihydroxy-2-naphthoate octaprenyltransferase